jgi:acyl dehydratase
VPDRTLIIVVGGSWNDMPSSVIENIVEAYLDNEDSADIANPIHSTEVAKSYGFDGPLVGGVTVWGWATDTILEALGEDWLENGWAEYSLRHPAYPGDRLTVRASQDEETGSASWKVEMINQDDEVCVVGRVGSGTAEWSSQLVRPVSMGPIDEIDPKGPLTLENAEAGKDWAAMSLEFSLEAAQEFIAMKQRTDNPLFTGENAIAHPSWTAGWAEKLLRHNFAIPTSMHTRSWVQHHRRLPVGSTVTGGAHLIQAYERKAHHFANFDVLLQDEQGFDIAQLRHWTIFKIATVEEREAQGHLT